MDPKDYPEFVDGITSKLNDVAQAQIPLSTLIDVIVASHNIDFLKRDMFYAKKPDEAHTNKGIAKLLAVGSRVLSRGFDHSYVKGSDLKLDLTDRVKVNLLHGLVGILSEMGELAEILMDLVTSGEVDLPHLLEELGDQRFYTQLICNSANELDTEQRFTDENIRLANMAKLRVRYATDEAVGIHSGGERDYEAEKKAMKESLENADISTVS